MRNYAVGLAILFATAVAAGLWWLTAALAVIVLLAGWLLSGSYGRWMAGEPAPEHRPPLDRLVRWQWTSSACAGLASAAVVVAVSIHTLHTGTVARGVQALLVAGGVALTGVFVSSMVDWYWVLPRVGGLGDHLAPCEAPGERWKYPTAIWLFHRGVATALVVASIAAVPLYLAATLGTPAAKVALGVIGVVLGGGMAVLNQRGLASLTGAFNQSIYVGDTVLINQAGEGEHAPIIRRRAYVVDVSVQGLKYQLLEGDDFRGPRFERKGHGPVLGGDEYRAIDRVEGSSAAPCRNGCSGVNWYCRNNRRAYDF